MKESAQATDRGAARRKAIVAAALQDVGELGLHRVTHRSIAARAGVPLGSLTYHFTNLEAIFEAAFASMVTRMSADYRRVVDEAVTREDAERVVVDLICGASYMQDHELRTLFEMYSFSSFNPAVHELCRDWIMASRASLSRHFSPPTGMALDALVEGWPMHRLWAGEPLDREVVHRAVHAIVIAFER